MTLLNLDSEVCLCFQKFSQKNSALTAVFAVFSEEPVFGKLLFFSKSVIEKLKTKYQDSEFVRVGDLYTIDLSKEYKTDSDDEEAACFFLDKKSGCMLNDDEKPLDCKIWPLRIMKDAEHLVIALTPTCKEINKLPVETVKEFVQSGIGEYIRDKAMKMPDIIKEYRSDFPVIMTFSD